MGDGNGPMDRRPLTPAETKLWDCLRRHRAKALHRMSAGLKPFHAIQGIGWYLPRA